MNRPIGLAAEAKKEEAQQTQDSGFFTYYQVYHENTGKGVPEASQLCRLASLLYTIPA